MAAYSPLTVKVRNHGSLDQAVPAALLLPADAGKGWCHRESNSCEAGRPGPYRAQVFFQVPGQTEGWSDEIIFPVAQPAS